MFVIIVNLVTFPVNAILNALVIICIKAKSGLIRHKSNMVLAVLAFTDLSNRDFSSTCLRCSVMRLLYDP